MEYRRREIAAGLVVITAVMLLLAMIVLSSNVQDLFRSKKTVRAQFDRVEGIERSSPVKQAGRLVGKVTKIDLSREEGNKIVLTLRIIKETVVKRDSEISVKSPLVGEKYVEIGLGSPNSLPLMEGDVLDGKESLKLDQLTDTIVKVVEDIRSITLSIKKVTADPQFQHNLKKTVSNLEEATARINDVVKRNSGNIDVAMRDLKRVAREINTTADQLNRLTGSLNRVVAENRSNIHSTIQNLRDTPDQILAELEKVQKSITTPLGENREDLKKVFQNLEKMTQNLVEMTEELKKKPYRLIRK